MGEGSTLSPESVKVPSLISEDILSETAAAAIWRRCLHDTDSAAMASSGQLGTAGQHCIHIDNLGAIRLIRIDRHDLVRTLKLRYRDLVAIDPTLPLDVASVVFIRTRAIAVNLDVGGAIRVIICENQCFVLSLPKFTDPSITSIPTVDHPFVQRLVQCLSGDRSRSLSRSRPQSSKEYNTILGSGNSDADNGMFDADMPYELRALEVTLSAAIGILACDVAAVEEASTPAIDAMLDRVERSTLEKVSKVKNSIDRLQSKVSRLHEELRDLLEDDGDMADLYLSRRARYLGLAPLPNPAEGGMEEDKSSMTLGRNHQGLPAHYADLLDDADERRQRLHASGRRRRVPSVENSVSSAEEMEGNIGVPSFSSSEADAAIDAAEEASMRESRTESSDDKASPSMQTSPGIDPHDIEEAEDLLETMFVRTDFLLHRLRIVDERVDDTEDFLELDLDQRRNELVGLNLLVATVAMAFGFTAAIAGIFGMNLLNSELIPVVWVLPVVLVISIGGSTALAFFVFLYVRSRKLMFIPTAL